MAISGDGDGNRGSFGRGLLWALALSILLCWLPILGPLVAGVIGGRKARRQAAAFMAGLIPALLWYGAIVWVSQHELRIGGQMVTAGPLYFYGAMASACLLGGALLGSAGTGARLIGALVLAAGFAYFLPHAKAIRDNLAPFISAFAPSRTAGTAPESSQSCEANLVQLYKALQFYTDDWEGQLPPARQWMTLIKDKVPDSAMRCPAAMGGQGSKYGYSMNPQLSGKRLESVKNRDTTPLLFDSSDLSENAHEGPASLPKPGRHGGKDWVLYADGTAKQVTP